jgi:DNA-binding response OmpR family regulator
MSPAERIEELEAENAYLRQELGLAIDATQVAAVRGAYKLRPNACRILVGLALAHPKILARSQVYDFMVHWTDEPDQDRSLLTYTKMIRDRLGKSAIEVLPNVGLRLSAQAAKQLKEVLSVGEAV